MALFGALFLRETLDRRTLLFVAAPFAGLYVLLDPSWLGGARPDGILAGVGAGVAYAAAVVTAKPLRNTFTPGAWPPTRRARARATTFWLCFAGIKNIPAKQLGFVMYLDPLTAVLLSAAALREPLTVSTLLGGALILATGLLAVKQPHISLRHSAPTRRLGEPTMRATDPRLAQPGFPRPVPTDHRFIRSDSDVKTMIVTDRYFVLRSGKMIWS
jgi:drug/metabolite transporter (DMT)-like permease